MIRHGKNAVAVVDAGLQPYPGFHGERTIQSHARFGVVVILSIQLENGLEGGAQLGEQFLCVRFTIKQGEETFGAGIVQITDGNFPILQAHGHSFGRCLRLGQLAQRHATLCASQVSPQ